MEWSRLGIKDVHKAMQRFCLSGSGEDNLVLMLLVMELNELQEKLEKSYDNDQNGQASIRTLQN